MGMLTIGEFAQRSGLTIKALRFYHRVGVLTPARVDRRNGFRYYREEQIEDATLVRDLRRALVPVKAIQRLLGASGQERARQLELHRERLDRQSHELDDAKGALDELSAKASYEIEVRQLAELPLACITRTTTLEQLPTAIPMCFGELYGALHLWGITPAGPAHSINQTLDASGEHLPEVDVDSIPLLLGCPVTERALPDHPHIELRTLPAVQAHVTRHRGHFRGVSRAHRALAEAVTEPADQAPRELFIVGPYQTPDASQWQTEVQWPSKTRG